AHHDRERNSAIMSVLCPEGPVAYDDQPGTCPVFTGVSQAVVPTPDSGNRQPVCRHYLGCGLQLFLAAWRHGNANGAGTRSVGLLRTDTVVVGPFLGAISRAVELAVQRWHEGNIK